MCILNNDRCFYSPCLWMVRMYFVAALDGLQEIMQSIQTHDTTTILILKSHQNIFNFRQI